MNENSLNLDFNQFIDNPIYKLSKSVTESLEVYDNYLETNAVIERESAVENKIRILFKRSQMHTQSEIGKHPDFNSLAFSDETINQYICPLFIDIKDSTRLGLKYDLEFIAKFKNALIQMCIEVVRAFDGYVHRIMGDAVLVFFGSKNISKEQSILDALTAISMLDFYLTKSVKPWLKEQQPDFDEARDFGFRIGCNFGNDDEVLWSNYGYWQAGEISPTGFPIDIASKLQSLAKKNTVMLGQSLLDMINFPKEFSSIKTNDAGKEFKIVTPNYQLPNGNPINYKMRIFEIDKFLKGVLVDTKIKQEFFSNEVIANSNFSLKVEYLNMISKSWVNLEPNIIIPKNSKVKVTVSLISKSLQQHERFKVYFDKINHKGYNNEKSFSEKFTIPKMLKEWIYEEINPINNKTSAVFQRDCTFRGIHRIECKIKDKNDRLVFRDFINVPIQ